MGRVHRQPDPGGHAGRALHDYRSSGYQLRPLIRGILAHPLIFESLDEPNLVKPPIVYAAGVLRALGAPLRGGTVRTGLVNMQQQPYRPPNVAGWEGGTSWLNTNTVMGRFDMVVKAQYLKYSNYYSGTANYPPDVASETAEAVFERAYASVNRPWLAAGDAIGADRVGADGGRRTPPRRADSASTRCRP